MVSGAIALTLLLNRSRPPVPLDTSAELVKDTNASQVTSASKELVYPPLLMVLLVACVLKDNGVLLVLPAELSVSLTSTTHSTELKLSDSARPVLPVLLASLLELSSLSLVLVLQDTSVLELLRQSVRKVTTAPPVL
jgi:hypothetical protein